MHYQAIPTLQEIWTLIADYHSTVFVTAIKGSLLGSLNFKAVVIEVIYDKVPGPRWGFGFVTMSPVSEVEAAAQEFNGYLRNEAFDGYLYGFMLFYIPVISCKDANLEKLESRNSDL
ncbi:unnamed protein product [Microthlaspi erraticum]|uniref:RRM domain-containing protein n=1 Tax=Microthlaspi erraticum TaxID=1685480 RepID=A0A6D2IHP4_9BRAS|nr:unnamed protein product [Microthlaspi erraticum]